eukprot:TRINITY_DN15760_c0_g1_i1.p1 TRINITY_DN15760_c0_g1~~TRINITY_DN15760_c0_g1_i1.p1  ORF type:complete len:294 (+),score=72.47 TRINITY_DN15760_c0_g1_i1:49-882(+)
MNPAVSRIIGTVDMNGKGTEHALAEVSPFILLDRAIIQGPGKPQFGAHPHAGFAVASIFFKGSFKSWDNIQDIWEEDRVAGSVYYVNAGRGVVHAEETTGEENGMFQLWMNVPQASREEQPTIQFAPPEKVPEFKFTDSATVRLILGTFHEHTSPVKLPSELFVILVEQNPGSTIDIPVPRGWNVAIVNNPAPPLSSSLRYMDTKVDDCSILTFGDGEFLRVTAEDLPARYLVLAGAPLEGTWVKLLGSNGALIESTREEAEKKMAEYDTKKLDFGK